ncbi:MAG: EAL domain-containing protein, partial [Lachnospiraceae bacterium]|nr:EAL domain-containing protein [Lachnospiraceae bacterium]
MSSVFFNNGIEEFLQILQSHAETQEEVAAHTAQALSCIADIMHIGKVEVYLSAPQSKLRDKIDDFSNVLYGGTQEIAPEPYAFDFRTGDGGLAVFTFYAAAGYAWNKFEQAEIGIFAKQIYLAFSQVMMGSLLKRSMLTDLSVGIPNVSGVMEYAGRLFGRGILTEYTAIYFNIHNFRYVNKVLPHLQADEVMKLYANMVANSVTSQELVGRLGGDNFVALVRTENAENFVNFISNMDIIYPYVDEVKRFNFSATIGVGNLEGIRNVGELMQRSSIAYQMARQSESTAVAYYTDEMYREIMQQKETIARFHRAIKQKEFVVYYQPKITTADKKICGAEALVRWKEKDRIIPPGMFIPILEKDGSICKLDFYVLDQVCDFLERRMQAGLPLLKISVNFSRKH